MGRFPADLEGMVGAEDLHVVDIDASARGGGFADGGADHFLVLIAAMICGGRVCRSPSVIVVQFAITI
jgi:hypothetical protein